MSSVKITQIGILCGTLLLIVLLLFGSKTPSSVREHASETASVDGALDQAVAKVQGSKPMEGIIALRDISKAHPENIRAHWHLAEFSIMSGQLEKAESRLHQVIKLDKSEKWLPAYTLLGDVLNRQEKYAEAIEALETFVSLSDNNAAKQEARLRMEEIKKHL